jgi:hypothetical protein
VPVLLRVTRMTSAAEAIEVVLPVRGKLATDASRRKCNAQSPALVSCVEGASCRSRGRRRPIFRCREELFAMECTQPWFAFRRLEIARRHSSRASGYSGPRRTS